MLPFALEVVQALLGRFDPTLLLTEPIDMLVCQVFIIISCICLLLKIRIQYLRNLQWHDSNFH